jgi:hypothetical protein
MKMLSFAAVAVCPLGVFLKELPEVHSSKLLIMRRQVHPRRFLADRFERSSVACIDFCSFARWLPSFRMPSVTLSDGGNVECQRHRLKTR